VRICKDTRKRKSINCNVEDKRERVRKADIQGSDGESQWEEKVVVTPIDIRIRIITCGYCRKPNHTLKCVEKRQ
jgi:hypothetical protein